MVCDRETARTDCQKSATSAKVIHMDSSMLSPMVLVRAADYITIRSRKFSLKTITKLSSVTCRGCKYPDVDFDYHMSEEETSKSAVSLALSYLTHGHISQVLGSV